MHGAWDGRHFGPCPANLKPGGCRFHCLSSPLDNYIQGPLISFHYTPYSFESYPALRLYIVLSRSTMPSLMMMLNTKVLSTPFYCAVSIYERSVQVLCGRLAWDDQ